MPHRIVRRLRPLCRTVLAVAALAPALAFPGAGALRAQAGAIVVRLGADTLSVERFTRSATRMEGDVIRRLPAAAQWHYVVELDGRGLPTRAELTPARGTPALLRIRRVSLTFEADSATIAVERDTVARRRVAAVTGFPILPETYGFFELWLAWLRRTGADSGNVTVVAPLGGPQGRLRTRLTRDSAFVQIIGGELRLRTDAQGRVLSLDGRGTTLKYTAERVRSIDLDRTWASFAARDSALGAPGSFLSRRDTARATIGGAQLWVDYGRPAKRGRAVFDQGVLGDTLWRTGANAATQLRTDRDLVLGGHALPAGTYSLWMHFGGGAAELVVNGQAGQWGTQYDRARDLFRVPLERTRAAGAPVEVFTIEVVPGGAADGVLRLSWDDAAFSVAFTVP